MITERDTLDAVRRAALWFEPSADGLDSLVERCRNAGVVLIGEASHGTHEFYRTRAELTKALIAKAGFNLVAVEADWPDAYRVNRWARQASTDDDAEHALGDFVRFPRWMWRNSDVVEFVTWLHDYNSGREATSRVGFYGLDLYSLHTSIEAVLAYLRKVDPPAAERARYRYGCFEHFAEDTQAYGYAATFGLSRSCEDDAIAELVELRRRAAEYATRDGRIAADDYFFAEQNARLVRNAEQYYRSMFGGRVESWNLRDTHMMETLEALLQYTRRTAGEARAVVWAHNSHLGDARATQMGDQGELNIGQLARERFGADVRSIGFTTHTGTVTAASNWDEPAQRKRVRPSLAGSYERLFHDAGIDRFWLDLADPSIRSALAAPRLERAIGVIYRPDSERLSHYFRARLSNQFDAVIHIDETHALQPLEPWAVDEADLPETYPTAL
ncbi:MAG TPA: erythromycin esterase family protein [Vicinamibacterales bacterium]|nr:erythromycin esterase family protein [Vicinamibacterales bacterium]